MIPYIIIFWINVPSLYFLTSFKIRNVLRITNIFMNINNIYSSVLEKLLFQLIIASKLFFSKNFIGNIL